MIDKKDKIIGIYKIENKYNHKIYIGQSKDIITRCKQHKTDLKNKNHTNKYLQSDFLKYGLKGFTFEILESCKQSELIQLFGAKKYNWEIVLLCREYYYINKYSKINELYNIEETLKKELLGDIHNRIISKFNNVSRNRKKQSNAFKNFLIQNKFLIQDNNMTLLEMINKTLNTKNKDIYIDYGKTYRFSDLYNKMINLHIVPNNTTKKDLEKFLIKNNIVYKNNIIQPNKKYVDKGYFALDKPKYVDDEIVYYRLSITKNGMKYLINFIRDNYSIGGI